MKSNLGKLLNYIIIGYVQMAGREQRQTFAGLFSSGSILEESISEGLTSEEPISVGLT